MRILLTEITFWSCCVGSIYIVQLSSRLTIRLILIRLEPWGMSWWYFIKRHFLDQCYLQLCSVHTMCAHYWELFQINDCSPIAEYSEQSSEHWNKHIRNIKSGAGCRARQTSIQVNTHDIFVRISIRSHPFIALKKRIFKCSKCSFFGHTAMSCKLGLNDCLTLERSIIEECYIK